MGQLALLLLLLRVELGGRVAVVADSARPTLEHKPVSRALECPVAGVGWKSADVDAIDRETR